MGRDMSKGANTGIWIIATGVIIALLYLGRNILAPFALAVFLYLVIEGFARAIDNSSVTLKRTPSRIIAILTVVGGFVGFIALMARGIAQFGRDAGDYERKIIQLISDAFSVAGIYDAP